MDDDAYTAEFLAAARGWALIGGAADDADDVAQEAMIRLWLHEATGARWAARAARYRYVHLCVRSILIDRARSAASRRYGGAVDEHIAGGDVEREALGRLALAEALAALAALGRDGQCVAMSARGHTVREISQLTGIRERTVYAALAAGRRALIRREDPQQ